MNNETDIGIRFTNKVTGENKLEKYAESLSKIKAAMTGFNSGQLTKIEQTTKSINQQESILEANNTKLTKGFKTAFDVAVVATFAKGLEKVYKTMIKLATKSSDYLENFNLFQVAFDGNYQSAEKFVNKMSEMYGLDESWGVRTVGIFKQLSNAMDLSVEQGTKLSTLLTQMSVDISSLYNVDIDKASSVLQSALAGQTKPIRGTTGADITQATLQTTLGNLGIDRYVSDLSYAEKRLLIIISLTRQLSEATGDFGRTIESPANQMRILSEQFSRLGRAVGNVFLPILAKILPYLNAILMVLTEIISAIARLFGYKEEDYDYFGGTADSVLELQDNLEGANESAQKLKHGLRGFDKLNVITTPSSSNVGISGAGGIDPSIMNAFNDAFDDYNKKLKDVEMKATKIRDSIMEWLGFTKLIDEETGKISFKFDHITGGTVLGALAVGGTIFVGIKKIVGFASSISKLLGIGSAAKGAATASTAGAAGSAASSFGITAALILEAVAAIITYEKEIKSLNTIGYEATWVEKIADVLSIGPLGSLAKATAAIVNGFSEAAKYGEIFDSSISDISTGKLKPFIDDFMKLSETIAKFNISDEIISDKDVQSVKSRLNKISSAIINELDADKNASLANITPLEELMGIDKYNEIKRKIENYYEDKKSMVKSNEDKITKIIENANKENRKLTADELTEINKLNEEIAKSGAEAMTETEEEFTKIAIRLGENFGKITTQQASEYLKTAADTRDKAIKNAQEQYEGVVLEAEKMKQAGVISEEEYNSIVASAKKAKEDSIKEAEEQYDGILNKTKEKLGEEVKYIDEKTGEIKSNIAVWWNDVWSWIKTNMFPYFTQEYWENLLKGLPIAANNIISKLKGLFENFNINIKLPHFSWASGGYETSGVIKKILETLNLPTTLPKLNVAWYDKGGLPPVGQLFVANEKGPELVGNLGGQSFVANQNQIVDFLNRKAGQAQTKQPQIYNIYLDKDHKLATYTLDQLQDMAISNGKPITLGA